MKIKDYDEMKIGEFVNIDTDHYQDGYYIFSLGRFFDMWREGPCVKNKYLMNNHLV